MKTAMNKKIITKAIIVGLFAISSQPALAVNITFDYSYDTNNFFDTAAKKNVLSEAGSFFSNLLTDNLTAITSSGPNQFNAVFSNPGSGAQETINGYSVAADTLVVYAGGRALSGNTLGVGGPGGYGASGTSQAFFDSIDRGQAGVSSGTDFAPWGGSITFNSGSNWYFDQDVTTSADVMNNDFYSVALHELGHLLGLGTSDSWNNLVTGTDFTGAASAAVNGGAVALNTPGLAHWASGTQSVVNGMPQEAAMDPSITTGTRKVFTELDIAALKDIGWQVSTVSAVPVPAAVWLFGSGLLGLVGVARRRS